MYPSFSVTYTILCGLFECGVNFFFFDNVIDNLTKDLNQHIYFFFLFMYITDKNKDFNKFFVFFSSYP